MILNPAAGSAGSAALQAMLRDRDDVSVFESRAPGDARARAAEAVQAGARRVIACGGDGTINEVVNGLVVEGRARAILGIVPLGTGNDLARTLGLPTDPEAALALALAGHPKALDLIAAESEGRTVYGANAAAGGFSGQVDEVLSDDLKRTWGPLAYLLGAAQVLPDIATYTTRLQYEDGDWEHVEVLNAVVANGRTVGGGKNVAPTASPDDGRLDVVIVRNGSAVALAAVAARLMAANYLDSELVSHRLVKAVRIESRPGMWFNLDGELLTNAPIVFRCLAGVLPCAVAGDGHAE